MKKEKKIKNDKTKNIRMGFKISDEEIIERGKYIIKELDRLFFL